MYLGTPQSSPRARGRPCSHPWSHYVELQSLSLQRVSVTGRESESSRTS